MNPITSPVMMSAMVRLWGVPVNSVTFAVDCGVDCRIKLLVGTSWVGVLALKTEAVNGRFLVGISLFG